MAYKTGRFIERLENQIRSVEFPSNNPDFGPTQLSASRVYIKPVNGRDALFIHPAFNKEDPATGDNETRWMEPIIIENFAGYGGDNGRNMIKAWGKGVVGGQTHSWNQGNLVAKPVISGEDAFLQHSASAFQNAVGSGGGFQSTYVQSMMKELSPYRSFTEDFSQMPAIVQRREINSMRVSVGAGRGGRKEGRNFLSAWAQQMGMGRGYSESGGDDGNDYSTIMMPMLNGPGMTLGGAGGQVEWWDKKAMAADPKLAGREKLQARPRLLQQGRQTVGVGEFGNFQVYRARAMGLNDPATAGAAIISTGLARTQFAQAPTSGYMALKPDMQLSDLRFNGAQTGAGRLDIGTSAGRALSLGAVGAQDRMVGNYSVSLGTDFQTRGMLDDLLEKYNSLPANQRTLGKVPMFAKNKPLSAMVSKFSYEASPEERDELDSAAGKFSQVYQAVTGQNIPFDVRGGATRVRYEETSLFAAAGFKGMSGIKAGMIGHPGVTPGLDRNNLDLALSSEVVKQGRAAGLMVLGGTYAADNPISRPAQRMLRKQFKSIDALFGAPQDQVESLLQKVQGMSPLDEAGNPMFNILGTVAPEYQSKEAGLSLAVADKIGRYSPKLGERLMKHSSPNWLTYAAMKNQGGALDITEHIPQGGLKFDQGTHAEVIGDFLKGVGEKLGVSDIESKMLTIRGKTTSATMLPFRQMGSNDDDLGGAWRGLFSSPSDGQIRHYQSTLDDMDTESFRKSLSRTSGVTAYSERYFASDTVAPGRTMLDPRTAQKMAANMKMPYEDFRGLLLGKGVRGSVHGWPFHGEIQGTTYGLDEEANQPMVSRELQLSQFRDNDADMANFILHGSYNAEKGEYQEFAGASEFANRSLSAESSAVAAQMAMGGERSLSNYIAGAQMNLGRAPTRAEILYGYQHEGERQPAYNPNIRGFADKTQNVYEESMQDSKTGFFGRLLGQVKTALSPADRAGARIDETEKKMQMGLIHQQTAMQAGLMANSASVNAAFPHVGQGLRDYLHSQGDSITDLTPARVMSQGLARLYQTPLDLQSVSPALSSALAEFSYNYTKAPDYHKLIGAFAEQSNAGQHAFSSEEMGALFGDSPESMREIAGTMDEFHKGTIGVAELKSRYERMGGLNKGSSAVGQMMEASRAYHINEAIAKGDLRRQNATGDYKTERGETVTAAQVKAAAQMRAHPMYALTAQLVGAKNGRPIEEYTEAVRSDPLMSAGVERRMERAGVGIVSPDQTQATLNTGQASLFPLDSPMLGPQDNPNRGAPMSPLGNPDQMSMNFAGGFTPVNSPEAVPQAGGGSGMNGAPPRPPSGIADPDDYPDYPQSSFSMGSQSELPGHTSGGAKHVSDAYVHASRNGFAETISSNEGGGVHQGSRGSPEMMASAILNSAMDRMAQGIGKKLQAGMFDTPDSAKNFSDVFGSIVRPNGGGFDVNLGNGVFEDNQDVLTDQGSNFFTGLARFESGGMHTQSERQSFSNLAKRASRGLLKAGNKDRASELWGIHERAEGMIDSKTYGAFSAGLQKEDSRKGITAIESIAKALAGMGDGKLGDAAEALTKSMKKVAGILDDFGDKGVEMTSTMDKSRKLLESTDSAVGDLQKNISAMAQVGGDQPGVKEALGHARNLLGQARSASSESGSMGSMIEETHGPGSFNEAQKAARGGGADRLLRTMLGFQMLRGVRMAFNPLEQAAAAFSAQDDQQNAMLGFSGQGLSRGATPQGRAQMGLTAIQEGLGRNSARFLSGVTAPFTSAGGSNGNLLGTLGTALLPAAGAAFSIASLAPAMGWTADVTKNNIVGAGLAVGAGSILAGAFGATQDPASMALSTQAIANKGDWGAQFKELLRDPLSAMGSSLSTNTLWRGLDGVGGLVTGHGVVSDWQNRKAAERAPYEAALRKLQPGLMDTSKAPIVSNMTGIEASMFGRAAFETDTAWSRIASRAGLTPQAAQTLYSAQASRTAPGGRLSAGAFELLANMPSVQMGDYSILSSADQYAQLQGSGSSFGGLGYIAGGMTAQGFEQGAMSANLLGGAQAARSLMYNGVTSNVESFRKQYLSEDGTVTPYNERRAAATTFASEFYGASGRKRSITASSENFGKMAAQQNMSPDRALSALAGYARRQGNFDPYAAADYMGNQFDLRFTERQGSNYEAMGGLQGEAFFNKAGFGGGFAQMSNGAYLNPMVGEVMQGIAGGDPYYASKAMDAGMINTGGGPTMDTTTGAPLFRRTMYGLPNGSGGYYQKPTANQVGSYFASVLPGRTAGRSTGTGAYAGHLNSVMTGGVYSGLGGQLGLQMESAVVSRDSALASAGIQMASIRAGHQYSVNVEQPFAWTQQEMGYAAQVGGVVNTPYMQSKGIGAMDFGRGQLAINRAGLGLQLQDMAASYQQGQTRTGWQLQDIGIEQGRTNTRNQWQREDFAIQGQQIKLNRGMQLYQFQFQQQELGFQRKEIDIGRKEAGEDFTYNRGMRQLQFGWTMEDADTNIRRATGFQRKQLVKERDRAVVLNNKETDRDDVLKKRQDDAFNRQEETIKRQEEKLKKELAHFKAVSKIEDDQFGKQKKRFEEEAKWKDEDYGKQRGRITQELSWAEEGYKRSLAQIELRKEQMTIEEQATVKNHELAVARFDDDKAHEEEMYALNLASAGVAATAANKQFEISQRQLEMQLIEEKNQDAMSKFIKDVKWEVFAKMVRDLISLTNGGGAGGQTGGQSPSERDENNSGPPSNKDKDYQTPYRDVSFSGPGSATEDTKYQETSKGDSYITVKLDSGVLVKAVVDKGAKAVQIDTKRNMWRN